MDKRALNKLLARTVGYTLIRSAEVPTLEWDVDSDARERLLAMRSPDRVAEVIGPSLEPALVLSPPHDGLRLVARALDAHDDVHVLPGITVAGLGVRVPPEEQRRFAAAGIGYRDLQAFLWDGLVRDLLARSGKRHVALVDDAAVRYWSRLKDVWPAARFVYLVRNPRTLVGAVQTGGKRDAAKLEFLVECAAALDLARTVIPGLTVKYEELEADPDAGLRTMSDFLGIEFREDMVLTLKGDLESTATGSEAPPAKRLPRDMRPLLASWGYA